MFKEFGKSIDQKSECFNYAKEHSLAVWQRDLNASGAKILLADTHENIFNKIKSNNSPNYYEYWNANSNIKLFIDYDRKIELEDPSDLKKRVKIIDEQNNHKSDVLNIINYIKSIIPNITATHILKSVPNLNKKSYHIVFDGIYFNNRSTLKKFMEEQLKPKFKELFDKKIIDLKVYGDLCFRTLLSTKFGQNRPLYLIKTDDFLNELQENIITRENTTLEHFLKCSISYIPESSQFYNYKPEKKKNNNKKEVITEDIYSDKEIVKKYLDLLDADRYTDYNKWLNIGFILYSINSDFIDLWHYFSQKWEHYDESIANNKWNSFSNSEYIYTINNLKFLARCDNPDDCEELDRDVPDHDLHYLKNFDNILSKYIARLYGEKFVCSDPKSDTWYYYNNIRWKKENKSLNLRKKIINEVFNKIESYRKQLIKDGASDDNIKVYNSILQKLSTGIKLNCLELEFYNENFDQIIDQNKDLIGFENGIYDLTTMEFRGGFPSDYVSLSTGYDYVPYDKDHELYKRVIELIEQILPDSETREFTLKSLASCLDGHNRDENFYIWSGKNASGGNGKSTITELLTKALGEYAVDSPVSLITGKRESSNSPNSALVAIRNKRAVIMQEPESNDQIQAGVLKSLTGGDRISTRELNSTQITFKPNSKFFLCCNRLPTMSDIDGGVIRRLKITEFTSKFVDEPKDYTEFRIDKELKSKLDIYKPVFMSILLDYYIIYKRDSLKPPESVLSVTKKYENNNNNIKAFVDENIVKGKKNDFITLDEVKNLYKADNFIRQSFPKISTFISQLESALCSEFRICPKRKTKKMDGYTLKDNYDLDDEEIIDTDE
jgi:P4 family phage/plasmid primase-like protien